ncbi:hypothetical protein TRIUR3_28102 [Triticum urartu]|uniref:Uncharacterized protein n=1 Tax=Triticum urartu TaxID=4572 RepID=M7Z1I5_TRIUA|nr:hypothetical protein TRIUR3_28102 [Triticum urartu]
MARVDPDQYVLELDQSRKIPITDQDVIALDKIEKSSRHIAQNILPRVKVFDHELVKKAIDSITSHQGQEVIYAGLECVLNQVAKLKVHHPNQITNNICAPSYLKFPVHAANKIKPRSSIGPVEFANIMGRKYPNMADDLIGIVLKEHNTRLMANMTEIRHTTQIDMLKFLDELAGCLSSRCQNKKHKNNQPGSFVHDGNHDNLSVSQARPDRGTESSADLMSLVYYNDHLFSSIVLSYEDCTGVCFSQLTATAPPAIDLSCKSFVSDPWSSTSTPHPPADSSKIIAFCISNDLEDSMSRCVESIFSSWPCTPNGWTREYPTLLIDKTVSEQSGIYSLFMAIHYDGETLRSLTTKSAYEKCTHGQNKLHGRRADRTNQLVNTQVFARAPCMHAHWQPGPTRHSWSQLVHFTGRPGSFLFRGPLSRPGWLLSTMFMLDLPPFACTPLARAQQVVLYAYTTYVMERDLVSVRSRAKKFGTCDIGFVGIAPEILDRNPTQ